MLYAFSASIEYQYRARYDDVQVSWRNGSRARIKVIHNVRSEQAAREAILKDAAERMPSDRDVTFSTSWGQVDPVSDEVFHRQSGEFDL